MEYVDYVKDDPYLEGYADGYEDGLSTRNKSDVAIGSVVILIVAVVAFTLGAWG